MSVWTERPIAGIHECVKSSCRRALEIETSAKHLSNLAGLLFTSAVGRGLDRTSRVATSCNSSKTSDRSYL